MPSSYELEVARRINKLEKELRRLETLIVKPAGSGTLHNAVTVTDTATVNLTLTGQNIQADVVGGAGHTIEDEGVPLSARSALNFIGAGVTATDNAGTDATDVTIPGGVSVANLGSTAETVGGAKDDGTAATASRSDHKHAITNPKIDDLATADDNTDLNANTTNHGLLLKATAPAATLLNVVGIGNGETVYSNKPMLDSTAPEALGVAASGSQVVAARRDHVHVMPKLDDTNTPDDNTDLNANTTNHGLLLKAVAPAAGLSTVVAIENGETVWKTKALFDTTNPEDVAAVADPGTSLIAARRDHVHAGSTGSVGSGSGFQIDQAGGTGDTFGVLAGDRDGANTQYTVSLGAYITGTLSVYLNGQLQTQGSAEDWEETTPTSGTFDFITPPEATDEITVIYGGGLALDGWIPASDSWTYASSTTITIDAGGASRYSIGDKIRFQNNDSGTYLYAYIVGVADTTLTVAGDAVPNATLTDTYYSHVATPLGFPNGFDYTPTWGGFSANPTVSNAKYTVSGRVCIVGVTLSGYGTSNSTSLTCSVPITSGAYNIAVPIVFNSYNNGAGLTFSTGLLGGSSSTITFYSNNTFGGWTASNGKGIQFSIVYSI